MSGLDILDDGFARLRGRGALIGALMLSVLPGRLALVELLWAIATLPPGSTVAQHADALRLRALVWLGLWLAGLAARQAFAGALRRDGRPVLPPWQELLGHGAVAVTLTVISTATLPTVIFPLLTVPLVGLAAAAPGVKPWRALSEVLLPGPLLLIGLAFLIGTALTVVNAMAVAHGVLWLVDPLIGAAAAARWSLLLDSGLAWLMAGAIATTVVEPAWTSVLVALASRAAARRTGEDLTARLERLS